VGVIHRSCVGYDAEPFATLVAEYPGEEVFPQKDFRVEWGPIFHRGRLDGSARVLVLGQDPAAHEAISRRILVGEAGQRVQGLLRKVGITSSYVMVNVYLYSVFGQAAGNRHIHTEAIAAYRNRWLDALLVDTDVSTVMALGGLARQAYAAWAATQPAAAARLHLATLKHPTFAESAARATGRPLTETTAELLADWNTELPGLVEHIDPEDPVDATPYGTTWGAEDRAPIPEADLPPGSPPWWRALDGWASRVGDDAQQKRATIRVAVPEGFRTWPAL
jgi:hypothetical protein